MNKLGVTNLTHLPNNNNAMGFTGLIQLIRLDFNNLAHNEDFLDKLFLHGKYARQTAENFTSNVLEKYQAVIAQINNNKKIIIFARLLDKKLISKEYYETQISRYQIKPLKNWCKHSIFKQLPDHNKLEELPLPTCLKDFLKEEDTACTNTQTNSFRP